VSAAAPMVSGRRDLALTRAHRAVARHGGVADLWIMHRSRRARGLRGNRDVNNQPSGQGRQCTHGYRRFRAPGNCDFVLLPFHLALNVQDIERLS